MAPLSNHSTSTPRCHHRASPMEWRIPGSPTWPGSLTESCLAVHSGSGGTGFWHRSQSLPGVAFRVQYSRGWSQRICSPDRMMKVIKNRLKKCCHRNQAGKPAAAAGRKTQMVPGY